jgi:hypothetical protein
MSSVEPFPATTSSGATFISPGRRLDQSRVLAIRIMNQTAHRRAQHRPQPLGWSQRVDIGGKVHERLRIQTGLFDQIPDVSPVNRLVQKTRHCPASFPFKCMGNPLTTSVTPSAPAATT